MDRGVANLAERLLAQQVEHAKAALPGARRDRGPRAELLAHAGKIRDLGLVVLGAIPAQQPPEPHPQRKQGATDRTGRRQPVPGDQGPDVGESPSCPSARQIGEGHVPQRDILEEGVRLEGQGSVLRGIRPPGDDHPVTDRPA